MATLAHPCRLCGTPLRPVVNRQTKCRTTVEACEHCDLPCSKGSRCRCCLEVTKAMRP